MFGMFPNHIRRNRKTTESVEDRRESIFGGVSLIIVWQFQNILADQIMLFFENLRFVLNFPRLLQEIPPYAFKTSTRHFPEVRSWTGPKTKRSPPFFPWLLQEVPPYTFKTSTRHFPEIRSWMGPKTRRSLPFRLVELPFLTFFISYKFQGKKWYYVSLKPNFHVIFSKFEIFGEIVEGILRNYLKEIVRISEKNFGKFSVDIISKNFHVISVFENYR